MVIPLPSRPAQYVRYEPESGEPLLSLLSEGGDFTLGWSSADSRALARGLLVGFAMIGYEGLASFVRVYLSGFLAVGFVELVLGDG